MKDKQKKKTFSFMSYIWKHKFLFLLYLLFTAAFFTVHVVATVYSANALALLTTGNYDEMLWQFGYAFICIMAAQISSFVSNYIYASLVRDIATEMRNDLTDRIFVISSKSFNQNSTGMFVSRISTSPNEIIGRIADFIDIIGGVFSTIAIVFYIMFLNLYIGLIIIGVILILSVFEYFKVKIYTKNKIKTKRVHDNIISLSNEIVRSEKDIKSLNLQEKLKDVSVETYDNYKKALFKEYTTNMCFWSARRTILEIFIFGLVIFSLYLLENGFLALSAMLYIFMNRSAFSNVVWAFGQAISIWADMRVETFRIKELFNDENYPIERFGNIKIEKDKFNGKITFKHVYFGYDDYVDKKLENLNKEVFLSRKKRKMFLKRIEQLEKDKKEGKLQKNMIIKNMSFIIPAGKTVAFVGRSGSGKSTILSLIPKLYEVDKGSVNIDGINVNDLSKETLRENISLVNQFPYIFNASIKENLLMANKDATDDMIQDALKRASLLEFVDALPNKIDTKVGENGIKLSGGQKQRLAIARALLKNSKIIIFDESTSSLDNFAQEDVRKSIEELKNKTVVIVAHRLSTIKHADIIFFIEEGNIIDKGTFDELFNKNEKFRDMFVAENLK